MSQPWKQGFVRSMNQGEVRLAPGQRWGFVNDYVVIMGEGVDDPKRQMLALRIVSLSPEGEVVLRPADKAHAALMFPEAEITFKGKQIMSRKCPFFWVEEARAKGSKGSYETGDFLAHEAWDVWGYMHLHLDDFV